MLIVLAGGTGASTVLRYLLDNHRFVGRNTLPKKAPPKGARIVVLRDYVPTSARDRMNLARKTKTLGGILVWFHEPIPALEVTLPSPVSLAPEIMEKQEKRRANAFAELERLLMLMGLPDRRR